MSKEEGVFALLNEEGALDRIVRSQHPKIVTTLIWERTCSTHATLIW